MVVMGKSTVVVASTDDEASVELEDSVLEVTSVADETSVLLLETSVLLEEGSLVVGTTVEEGRSEVITTSVKLAEVDAEEVGASAEDGMVVWTKADSSLAALVEDALKEVDVEEEEEVLFVLGLSSPAHPPHHPLRSPCPH
jgi:hypothetical protein